MFVCQEYGWFVHLKNSSQKLWITVKKPPKGFNMKIKMFSSSFFFNLSCQTAEQKRAEGLLCWKYFTGTTGAMNILTHKVFISIF